MESKVDLNKISDRIGKGWTIFFLFIAALLIAWFIGAKYSQNNSLSKDKTEAETKDDDITRPNDDTSDGHTREREDDRENKIRDVDRIVEAPSEPEILVITFNGYEALLEDKIFVDIPKLGYSELITKRSISIPVKKGIESFQIIVRDSGGMKISDKFVICCENTINFYLK